MASATIFRWLASSPKWTFVPQWRKLFYDTNSAKLIEVGQFLGRLNKSNITEFTVEPLAGGHKMNASKQRF